MEVMRNPDSYVYKDPYTLLMNPADAEHFDLKDGERVKLSTKRGSVEAPVEITYRAAKGYVMIPHHYGFEKDGKVFYGAKANDLTRGEDMDPITCNPYLRWVPCRIEKLR